MQLIHCQTVHSKLFEQSLCPLKRLPIQSRPETKTSCKSLEDLAAELVTIVCELPVRQIESVIPRESLPPLLRAPLGVKYTVFAVERSR